MNTIKMLAFALLATSSFSATSQIQNANFEEWTYIDTTWSGESIYSPGQWSGGKRTEDSYSGNFAAKVEPIASCGMMMTHMFYGAVSPNFDAWSTEPDYKGTGAPINAKPLSLSGYAQFLSPDSNDVATGFVLLKKFNASTGISEEVGRGDIEFTPTSGYVPFNIVVTDLMPGVMPDSIVVCFTSGMGFHWDENGSQYGTLYIDQLRMLMSGAVAGLEENALDARFYPNPVQDLLHVSFESVGADDFSLVLTDATGKQLLKRSVTAGIESTIETGNLPAGTYVVTLLGKEKACGRETILKVY